jgi:hypothetical protein
MNATTPEFIISPFIKMVVDNMSSLLRHDSLNNFLFWTAFVPKMTHTETSYIADFDLN